MNWLTENSEAIKLAATVVGLFGGLFGFYKFYDQKRAELASAEKKREEALDLEREAGVRARQASDRAWLQAALHQIFHKSDEPDLTFEVLFEKMVGSAYLDDAVELTKQSFNKKYLRRLLVEMIGHGVIEQTDNDIYSLKLRVLSPQDQLSRQLNTNNAAGEAILEIVRNSPSTYNTGGLKNCLAERNISISQMQFEVLLKQFEQQFELLTRDENGKWMPLL